MYRTTTTIISLAGSGSRIKAHSVVMPVMFLPEQWDALLAEGAIVEIKADEPATPAPVKATKRKAKNA